MKRFGGHKWTIALILSLLCLGSVDSAQGQFFKKLFGGNAAEEEAAQEAERQKQQQQQRKQQMMRQRQKAAQQRQQRGNSQRSNQPRQTQQQKKPAQKSAQTVSPRPVRKPEAEKPLPVIEEASAEARAKFGELIGANWIWSPAHEKDKAPEGSVYFRKTFKLDAKVEFAQVHITADNSYELFVNGKAVAEGSDWRKMEVHDVAEHLKPGSNVVAVKVSNTDEGPAGLVARVLTKEPGGAMDSASTDGTWRTSVKLFRNWNVVKFRDKEWLPAEEYGLLGAALPWGDEVVIASEGARFIVDPEFVVERITTDEQTGSLVAMTFNAEGEILASQEGGPLMRVADEDDDGVFETVNVFTDKINTAQGIMSLGPRVYAVGSGPDGSALYKISDNDRNGRADGMQAILKFRGSAGEHGPHAVRLGPDGMLYVMIGNFARMGPKPSDQSPYVIEYEGDLVRPKYEDPRGHAVGVPAPGGTVVRTDVRGTFAEVIAGGMRNSYDFAFNREGEMFTFDADMEWDMGTPWYRPTRIYHVTPGAEFGWRSGWSKWPSHYVDSLPSMLNLGGGSPTGVEFYDHFMFPVRLHNTLFVGDWGRGLIYAVKMKPEGGSYKAESAVFLKGRPLNITDMSVGPDGALYFCTGGRGTDGGIYRVRWRGTVPPEVADLGKGLEVALRQPQLDADWARERIAKVKKETGSRWETGLISVATNPRFSVDERRRAVDLLTFFGPAPSKELLINLAGDRETMIRAKAARLMGMTKEPEFDEMLANMLTDPAGVVRRIACESVVHRGQIVDAGTLAWMLDDEDRYVAFAARRALERLPAEEWQQVIEAKTTRAFLQGATGLMIAHPSKQLAMRILDRCESTIAGEVTDPGKRAGFVEEEDYLGLLRVAELALLRGDVKPEEAQSLASTLLEEFPTSKVAANRELVKLLVYLGPPAAPAEFAAQLAADIPEAEKLHLAAYAPRLKAGWQTSEKLAFLDYYESARQIEGGYSVSGYIENFARDFFTNLSLAERRQVLAAGERYPTSALSVLAKLPDDTDADVLATVREIDQRLTDMEGDVYDRLRVGIVATLGKFNDEDSREYLHKIYETQPERRDSVAMSLTQSPDGENWELLVDSLRSIEGTAAGDVLHTLSQIKRRPETAEPYRHVILQGFRLGKEEGKLATGLMAHWTGRATSSGSVDEQLAEWQSWYGDTFPDAPAAELPKETTANKWSYEELLSFLESEDGQSGKAAHGAAVFRSAECVRCHRMGNEGETLGPDLTTVASRFQVKEILESVVYPSHVISDQYASRAVTANGRTYIGIAVRDGDGGVVVLTADGEKVRLDQEDVEEIRASSQSAMPEGLLNPLTLEQVADLFAYLMDGKSAGVASRKTRVAR